MYDVAGGEERFHVCLSAGLSAGEVTRLVLQKALTKALILLICLVFSRRELWAMALWADGELTSIPVQSCVCAVASMHILAQIAVLG